MMRPVKDVYYLVLLLLPLMCGVNAYAQKNLNFTALTTKNGLSSNTINAVLQDRKGLIWFGTADGLNKFDGTNFTVYTHDDKDSTSLPANDVISLLEDKGGHLWVGTNGGGLACFNPKRNSFDRLNVRSTLPKNRTLGIRAIYQDHLQDIWIGSFGGLRVLKHATGKIVTIDISKLLVNPTNELAVLSFFEDNKQRMWIGTNSGLLRYDLKSKAIAKFTHNEVDQYSISGNEIRSIIQSKNGDLFFGTSNGFNQLMPDGKTFKVFHHSNDEASIASEIIYSTMLTDDNNIWIGTENGISIFDPLKVSFKNIQPDRRRTFTLSHKSVRCTYLSDRGIIWIGTFQGGVNKYDPNLALFNLEHSSPFDPKGLSSPIVTSFAEYNKNEIFVGTDGGGVHLFDKQSGLFEHVTLQSKTDRSKAPLSILALTLDSKKRLWAGTYQNGVFVYDHTKKTYKQYLAGHSNKDISKNDIFFIQEDSQGLIWIGTNGMGVDIFNPKTETFTRYKSYSQTTSHSQLPTNGFMRSFAEDKDGNIWLGSNGTGIALLLRKEGKFLHYNRANSGLSNDVVLSILKAKSGDIWVGTGGGGLDLFNKKTQRFSHLNETDGLANSIIYKILEDERGVIWASTDKGISSIDPDTKKIQNFSRSNGVQDSPFIVGSGVVTTAGELYFGGQDGFNYFLPTQLPSNNLLPRVLLTELKVANNVVQPGENAPINDQISAVKDIRLPYGQNFSITYVALNYTAPQQVQYSYKLLGLDQDWNYVKKEKTAYYTNLDPGDYIFQVRASNNDGVWNDQLTSVTIHILPPFWRTPWAYLAYFSAFAILLLYTRHRGIEKIKNELALEQEKLNAKKAIEQQGREAERIHELDQQKIKFLTDLSHEFRTPISLILAPAEKLFSAGKDQEIGTQVKMIRRNARRLLNLVNQLLDFRKLEEHELKLNLNSGDIIAFINDAADSFQDLSDKKKITLTVQSQIRSLKTDFDHDKVERIIFNLLSNAFKFTLEGGHIHLKTSLINSGEGQPGSLSISVSDTGIGIDPLIKDKIFDRFFTNNSVKSVLNQGSGIGLSITKEFVELHGGTITVMSQPDIGTTFLVTLPVSITVPYPDFSQDEPTFSDQYIGDDAVENTSLNPDHKNATILLVEDNDEFRFHLKESLKAHYHIVEASNGKEGWQKALSGHPQLIVSDISMPYLSGIELSHKIKADKRTCHIPVILLTAINGEEAQIKGLESGANDYLTKPFSFDILNTKIKNYLTHNQSLKNTYSKQIELTGSNLEIESSDVKLLNTIVNYIDEKLNNPELSVEDLSKHVGMSRGSLYHKLLELTSMSPIEYIRYVKLQRAADLLEKSDYNVAQIAYMTGFGTPSYFSRLFKSRYNELPSEYIISKRKESRHKTDHISS